MTWSLSDPPESSKVTLETLAAALASSTDEPPETLTPLAGTSTPLVGGELSTVTVLGALITVSPSASVATLWML